MDNNPLGSAPAAAPQQPTPFSFEPHKTLPKAKVVGDYKDAVGFHNYGTRRYDKHNTAGSELIKFTWPFISNQGNIHYGTSQLTTTVYQTVRDLLLFAGAKLMDRYESYSVEYLNLAFQFPVNWNKAHGFVRAGWIMDPERKNVPTYTDDGDQNYPMRYEDARLFRYGHHCNYTAPIPKARFFTGPNSDRFSSPGAIFASAWYNVNTPAGVPDSQSITVTITARINYYCPTIRTDVLLTFAQFPAQELDDQIPDREFEFGEAYNQVYAKILINGELEAATVQFYEVLYVKMYAKQSVGSGDDAEEVSVFFTVPVMRGDFGEDDDGAYFRFEVSRVTNLLTTPTDSWRYSIANTPPAFTPKGFSITE